MLRPHTARYAFIDAGGRDRGQETMRISPRPGGWLATSHLELGLPEALTCDVEWHLEADLSTHVLYIAASDNWGQDSTLELAVTGNGMLASRTGPDGPTQVEMGWGPGVELDHLSACFTTVILGRWNRDAQPTRDLTTVYIGAEDLVPEALDQHFRVLEHDPIRGTTRVQRVAPATGSSAEITVIDGGVVAGYQGLFRLTEDWAFLD